MQPEINSNMFAVFAEYLVFINFGYFRLLFNALLYTFPLLFVEVLNKTALVVEMNRTLKDLLIMNLSYSPT